MIFDDTDIAPGAQPYLDEDTLRSSGRCRTSAPIENGVDISAQKSRNYLILKVDVNSGICVAAPVLTSKNPTAKHIKLDNGLKRNFPAKAQAARHFVHSEQLWEMPIDVLKAASARDASDKTNRRFYPPDQPKELALALANYEAGGLTMRDVTKEENSS